MDDVDYELEEEDEFVEDSDDKQDLSGEKQLEEDEEDEEEKETTTAVRKAGKKAAESAKTAEKPKALSNTQMFNRKPRVSGTKTGTEKGKEEGVKTVEENMGCESMDTGSTEENGSEKSIKEGAGGRGE